jgi:hypothetical protein
VIGILPQINAVFNLLESIPAMIPKLGLAIKFIISPYFAPTMIAIAIVLLFWRHWPVPLPSRAKFFIEMLEERIALARLLLKQPKVGFTEWKAWEEKTVLDMARYLPSPSKHFKLFRQAGDLTTHEYEKGDPSNKVAIHRQVRMLNELIDRIDRGEIQKEVGRRELTSF